MLLYIYIYCLYTDGHIVSDICDVIFMYKSYAGKDVRKQYVYIPWWSLISEYHPDKHTQELNAEPNTFSKSH